MAGNKQFGYINARKCAFEIVVCKDNLTKYRLVNPHLNNLFPGFTHEILRDFL